MRGQNLVDHVLGKAEDVDAVAAAGHKMVDMEVDAFEACLTLKPKPQQQLEEHLKMGSSWDS